MGTQKSSWEPIWDLDLDENELSGEQKVKEDSGEEVIPQLDPERWDKVNWATKANKSILVWAIEWIQYRSLSGQSVHGNSNKCIHIQYDRCARARTVGYDVTVGGAEKLAWMQLGKTTCAIQGSSCLVLHQNHRYLILLSGIKIHLVWGRPQYLLKSFLFDANE